MSKEDKVHEFLRNELGQSVNELGLFMQNLIVRAFSAGWDARNEQVANPTSIVVEYCNKTTGEKFHRKADGLFYPEPSLVLSELIDPQGWDHKHFIESEFNVTKAINASGVTIAINKSIMYEDDRMLVHSLLEKPGGTVLACLGFTDELGPMDGPLNRCIKIININDANAIED